MPASSRLRRRAVGQQPRHQHQRDHRHRPHLQAHETALRCAAPAVGTPAARRARRRVAEQPRDHADRHGVDERPGERQHQHHRGGQRGSPTCGVRKRRMRGREQRRQFAALRHGEGEPRRHEQRHVQVAEDRDDAPAAMRAAPARSHEAAAGVGQRPSRVASEGSVPMRDHLNQQIETATTRNRQRAARAADRAAGRAFRRAVIVAISKPVKVYTSSSTDTEKSPNDGARRRAKCTGSRKKSPTTTKSASGTSLPTVKTLLTTRRVAHAGDVHSRQRRDDHRDRHRPAHAAGAPTARSTPK